MSARSRSVARSMRNVIMPSSSSLVSRRRAPHFDFNELDGYAAHVANLVHLAAVEPRPAALFAELERHRPHRQRSSVRGLDDDRLRGVTMRLGGLTRREGDPIRAEPAVGQLGLSRK